MFLEFDKLKSILSKFNIKVRGVLHIGAHDCEEIDIYNGLGVSNNDIIWIDAIESKVLSAKERGIPNVYHHVITDKDDIEVEFNISNNFQSSSILKLGTHKVMHPNILYVDKVKLNSITIDTFFSRNKIDAQNYNFYNMDIQGAELLALKGSTDSIDNVQVMYLEVNEKELYVGCPLIQDIDNFLLKHNFKRVWTHITQWGWGDALYIK